MKYQLRSIFTIASIGWIMITATSIMTGCSPERGSAQGKAAAGAGGADVLRVRHDAARNRTWLLGVDSVRVYDAASKHLIREVVLSNWSVGRFVCAPDLAIDSSGAAVISSNVQARLWRVDADSFEVKEREISLQGKERWDVGFGALTFAADGSLLGLVSTGGSLWKINVDKGSARVVELGGLLLNQCELTAQFAGKFTKE
jgi:hypothetical protein